MQEQSRQNQFINFTRPTETLIRNNVRFVAQTNQKMKEDIEAARRKLNQSAGTGFPKQATTVITVVGQGNQFAENNINVGNSQLRHSKSNQIIFTQPQGLPYQPKSINSQDPETTDEVIHKFTILLHQSKSETQQLRRIIAERDFSAQQTIGNLQGTIAALRGENNQLRINQERILKELNDGSRGNKTQSQCDRCLQLQARIRYLQQELIAINSRYDDQKQRKTDTGDLTDKFSNDLIEKLKLTEEKLLKSNQERQRSDVQNLQLKKKISDLQQRQLKSGEQYNILLQQYHNVSGEYEKTTLQLQLITKRQAHQLSQMTYFASRVEEINAQIDGRKGEQIGDKTELVEILSELQVKIQQLHVRLNEKTIQNRDLQSKLIEKDNHLKRLSDQYAEVVEKLDRFEEIDTHYKHKIYELQRELEKIRYSESPVALIKDQLTVENQRLEQQLRRQHERVQELRFEVTQKETYNLQIRNRLQEANHYIENIVKSNMDEQNETIIHLTQKNKNLESEIKEMKILAEKESHFEDKQSIHEKQEPTSTIKIELLQAQRDSLKIKIDQYQQFLKGVNRLPSTQAKRITELQQQLQRQKHTIQQLQKQIQLSKQRISKYSQIDQERTSIYNQLIVSQQKIEQTQKLYSKEIDILRKELGRLNNEKQTIYINLQKAESYIQELLEKQKSLMTEINRITIVNEELIKLRKEQVLIENNNTTLIDQVGHASHAIEEAKEKERKFYSQQIAKTVDQYEQKLRNITIQVRREIDHQYQLKIQEIQRTKDRLTKQLQISEVGRFQFSRKYEELQKKQTSTTVNSQQAQLQIKNQQLIKEIFSLQVIKGDLTKEITTLKSRQQDLVLQVTPLKIENDKVFKQLQHAEQYILQLEQRNQSIIDNESALLLTINSLKEDKIKSDLELKRLSSELTRGSSQIARLTLDFNRVSSELNRTSVELTTISKLDTKKQHQYDNLIHQQQQAELNLKTQIEEREQRMQQMWEENGQLKGINSEMEEVIRRYEIQINQANLNIVQLVGQLKIRDEIIGNKDNGEVVEVLGESRRRELEQSLEQSRILIANVNNDNEALKKVNIELNQAIRKVQTDIIKFRTYIGELQRDNIEKDSIIVQMKAHPITKIQYIQKEVSNELEVRELKKQINVLEQKQFQLSNQVDQLTNQLTQVKAVPKVTTQQVEIYTKQITQLTKDNELRVADINQLTSKLRQMQINSEKLLKEQQIKFNLANEQLNKQKQIILGQRQFFKNKLLQAEDYIATIEQQRSNLIQQIQLLHSHSQLPIEQRQNVVIIQLQKNMNVYVQENKQLHEVIAELERDNAKLNDQVLKIKRDLQLVSLSAGSVEEVVKLKEKNIIIQKQYLNEKQGYVKQIERLNNSLKDQQLHLSNQKNNLIKQIQRLNINLKETQTRLSNQKNNYAQQIEKLNISIKELQNKENLQKENKINQLMIQLDESRGKCLFINGKYEQAQETIRQYQQKNQQLESNLAVSTKKISDADIQIKKHSEDINRFQSENRNITGKLTILQSQIKQLSSEKTLIQSKLKNNDTLIIQLQQTINTKSVKIVQLQKELQPTHEDRHIDLKAKQLQKIIQDVRQQAQFFKTKLIDAEEYISQLESQTDIPQNTQQNDTISKQLGGIQKENQMLKERLKDVEDKINSLTSQKNHAEQKVKENLEVVKSLQLNIDSFKTQVKDKDNKIAVLETANIAISKDKQDKEKSLKEVTAEFQFVKNKLIEAQNYIAHLQQVISQQQVSLMSFTTTITATPIPISMPPVPVVPINIPSELIRQAQLLREQIKVKETELVKVEREKKLAEVKAIQNLNLYKNLEIQINNFTKQVRDSEIQISLLDNNKKIAEQKIQESKNQIANIQLNLEEVKSNAKKSQTIIATLQTDKKNIEKQLTQLQKIIAQLTKQVEFFKNKLVEAEEYIHHLQTQGNIDSVNDDKIVGIVQPSLVNQNADIQSLKLEIKLLESKNRQLESERRSAELILNQHLSAARQIERNLQDNKQKLKDSVTKVNQLENQKLSAVTKLKQSQKLLQTLQQSVSLLTGQLKENDKKIARLQDDKKQAEQRANYSQNLLIENVSNIDAMQIKLNEAHQYIQDLEHQNERIANDGSNRLQENDLKSVNDALKQKLVELENVIQNLSFTHSKTLQDKDKQIQNLVNKVQETENLKSVVGDNQTIIILQNQFQQAEKVIENLNLVNNQIKQKLISVQDEKQFIKEQLERSNEAVVTADADKALLLAENRQLKNDLNKLKLQIGSDIILPNVSALSERVTELETLLEKQIIKNIESTKQASILTEQLKQNQEKIKSLQDDAITVKDMVIQTEKSLQVAVKQKQFFKTKLFDAENYITQIEAINSAQIQIDTKINQNSQMKLKIVNLENQIKLLQKEREILSQKILNAQEKVGVLTTQVEFFKSKLLQAEHYIIQLENNSNIGEDTIDLTVNEVPNQNALNYSDLQDQIRDLQEKIQILIMDKANKEIKQRNLESKIDDLQHNIDLLENKIKSNDEEKQILKKAKEQAEKKLLESSQTSSQKSGKEKNPKNLQENAQFFKGKLLQAESYISELQIENTRVTKAVDELDIKMKSLSSEVANLRQKLLKSDGVNQQLLSQVHELNGENDDLKEKIQNMALAAEPQQRGSQIEQSNNLIQHLNEDVVRIPALEDKIKQLQQKLNKQQIDNRDKDIIINNLEVKIEEQFTLNKLKENELQNQFMDKLQKQKITLVQEIEKLSKIVDEQNKNNLEVAALQNKYEDNKQKQMENTLIRLVQENSNLQNELKKEKENSELKWLKLQNQLTQQLKHKHQLEEEQLKIELQQIQRKIQVSQEIMKEQLSDQEKLHKQKQFEMEKRIIDLQIFFEQLQNDKNKAILYAQETEELLKKLKEERKDQTGDIEPIINFNEKQNENEAKENSAQFFKEKLLEAEGFIYQLQKENDTFRKIIEQLHNKLQESGVQSSIRSLEPSPKRKPFKSQGKEGKAEIEAFKNENEQLNQQNKQIQGEIQQLKEKNISLQKQIKKISGENQGLTHKIQNFISSLASSEESILPYKQKIQQLEKQLKEEKDKHSKINQELQERINELDQAIKQKGQLNPHMEEDPIIDILVNPPPKQDYSFELEQTQTKLYEFEIENSDLRQDNEKLNEQIKKLQNKLESYEFKIQNISAQLKNAIQNESRWQDELQKYRNQNSLIRSQFRKSPNEQSIQTIVNQKIKARQDTFELESNFYKKEIDSLNKTLQQKEGEISQLYIDKKNAGDRFKDAINLVDRLKETVNTLTEKNQDNQEKIELLEREKQAVQKVYETAKSKIKSEEQLVQEKQNADKIEQKLFDAQKFISELQEENEALSTAVKTLNDQMSTLKEQVQNLNTKLINSDSDKVLLLNQNKQLKNQNQNLSNIAAHPISDPIQIASLKQKIQQQQQIIKDVQNKKDIQIQSLQIKLSEVLVQADLLENDKQQIQNKLADTQQQNASLKVVIQQKNIQIAVLSDKLPHIEASVTQMASLSAENTNLKDLIAKYKQEVDESQAHIAQLEDQRNLLTNQLDNFKSDNKGLFEQITAIKEKLDKSEVEKSNIEEENSQLKIDKDIVDSDLQKLNSKINYLYSLLAIKEKQIQDLKQLNQLNRQLNNQLAEDIKVESQPALEVKIGLQNESKQNSGILPQNMSEKHKQLEESLRSIKRELQKQMSEEDINTANAKQLQKQIATMTLQLQKKDEENRQLKVQKLNLQQENKQLKQTREDVNDQLQQHLVQAERHNMQLDEEIQKIEKENQDLEKQKAYLSYEINRLHAEKTDIDEQINIKDQRISQLQEQLIKAGVQVPNFSSQNRIKRQEKEIDENWPIESHNQSNINELAPWDKHGNPPRSKSNSSRSAKEEKLSDSLKKLIVHVNSFSEGINTEPDNGIFEQLEQFPYLQQFVKTLVMRLQIAENRGLEQNLQIKNLQNQLQAKKTQLQNINNLSKAASVQKKTERIQESPTSAHKSSQQIDENDLEDIKQQIQRQVQLQNLHSEVQQLKHIKQNLQKNIEQGIKQKQKIQRQLKIARSVIEELTLENEKIMREEEDLVNKKEKLEQDLADAELQINSFKNDNSQGGIKDDLLGASIRKIIDFTKNYSQSSIGEPEEQLKQLEAFPYLSELIESILYRLRLSSAIDIQKTLKIKNLINEIQALKKAKFEQSSKQKIDQLSLINQQLSEKVQLIEKENEELRENTVNNQRYQELINEVVEYQTLNKELQEKLNTITEEFEKQKEQINQYELSVADPDGDISRQNFQLRKKLQSSQRKVQICKLEHQQSSMNTRDLIYLEFLSTCLDRVMDVEMDVIDIEKDIEKIVQNAQNSSSRNYQENKSSSSANIVDKLQQLQQKLLKNATSIRQHQQKSDGQLFQLLKELIETKQLPASNRTKIQQYLNQLQNQILREHDQHQNQIDRLKEQIDNASSRHQQKQIPVRNQVLQEFPERGNKEDLLNEINNLNNAVEIYHQQSMRRKREYKQTMENLVGDLITIRDIYEQQSDEHGQQIQEELINRIDELGAKMRNALQREQDDDLNQLERDTDFIYSNNGMQIISKDQMNQDSLMGFLNKQGENAAVQTEQGNKPFLNYLLSNRDFDKEDIIILKKKIADLRAKEVQQNLVTLRGQERKLQEIFLQVNRESTPQQIQNVMITLANNYSRDEISQIFGSQDNDQILNKLNQALCLEESFYRGQNSSIMMRDIEERKKRYYEVPTKLSEEVYKHLIDLLSAKRDEQFYEFVDSLFHSLYEIEDGFQTALRKKDEVYRLHNERMNQIFNRSSSDNSQEYLDAFEGGQGSNQEQLQMYSQRKARRSEDSMGSDQKNQDDQ